jgi:hypothetical protein
MLSDDKKKIIRKNISIASEKAKEWHKSDIRREWHKEHFKKYLALSPKKLYLCLFCGKEIYDTVPRRFCSGKCAYHKNKELGKDREKRNCEFCGKEYNGLRYRNSRFCSRSCSAKYQWNKSKSL